MIVFFQEWRVMTWWLFNFASVVWTRSELFPIDNIEMKPSVWLTDLFLINQESVISTSSTEIFSTCYFQSQILQMNWCFCTCLYFQILTGYLEPHRYHELIIRTAILYFVYYRSWYSFMLLTLSFILLQKYWKHWHWSDAMQLSSNEDLFSKVPKNVIKTTIFNVISLIHKNCAVVCETSVECWRIYVP